MTLYNVVKTTVYLSNLSRDFDDFNEVCPTRLRGIIVSVFAKAYQMFCTFPVCYLGVEGDDAESQDREDVYWGRPASCGRDGC